MTKRQTIFQRPMTDRRVTQLLDINVAAGYLEWYGVNEKGEPLYRVTDEGKRHVEEDLLGGGGD